MVPGWLRSVPHAAKEVMIFEFGDSSAAMLSSSTPVVLLIPGLTDGPLSLPFAPKLSSVLRAAGWRLMTPILRSSFKQFGFCSLDTDAEDLRHIIAAIVQDAPVDQRPVTFALFGHSTGCQDVVTVLKQDAPDGAVVTKVILQGAVSDREALYLLEDHSTIMAHIALAKSRVAEGNGDECLPRGCGELFGVECITATRFLSLSGHLTAEDLFSSDLTDAELAGALHHVAQPHRDILVALCAQDEYVPPTIDPRIHGARLAAALGGGETVLIDGPHSCGDAQSIGCQQIVGHAARFITRNEHDSSASMAVTWEVDIATSVNDMAAGKKDAGERFIVGLCGMPGTGKTVSSKILSALLDCPLLQLDGFHYPKSVLAQFDDPEDALYRRGAPFTFNREQFVNVLQRCKDARAHVVAPTFDHSIGDPKENGSDINPSRILVVEGIYLLLWPEVRDLIDFNVFITADLELCVERLKIRNACIPGYTKDEMIARVDCVDRANCMVVRDTEQFADQVVPAVAV